MEIGKKVPKLSNKMLYNIDNTTTSRTINL